MQSDVLKSEYKKIKVRSNILNMHDDLTEATVRPLLNWLHVSVVLEIVCLFTHQNPNQTVGLSSSNYLIS